MRQEHLNLLQIISGIPGGVSTKEAIYLYETAKKCKKGAIVEIGSWHGKSTACLGLGAKIGGAKVYAIDPHTGSPDQRTYRKINTLGSFKQHMKDAGLEFVVRPVVTTSEEAIKNWTYPIEFIFVDANYDDYGETKKDFFRWSKFLTEGGIYALHNTSPSVSGILEGIPLHGWKAPRKFLNDYIFCSNNFKNLAVCGTITSMSKSGVITALDKIKNRTVQLKSALLSINHKLYLLSTFVPEPIKKFLKKMIAPSSIRPRTAAGE